jgi:hypothetical protein
VTTAVVKLASSWVPRSVQDGEPTWPGQSSGRSFSHPAGETRSLRSASAAEKAVSQDRSVAGSIIEPLATNCCAACLTWVRSRGADGS